MVYIGARDIQQREHEIAKIEARLKHGKEVTKREREQLQRHYEVLRKRYPGEKWKGEEERLREKITEYVDDPGAKWEPPRGGVSTAKEARFYVTEQGKKGYRVGDAPIPKGAKPISYASYQLKGKELTEQDKQSIPTTKQEFIESIHARQKARGTMPERKAVATKTGYGIIPKEAKYTEGFDERIGTGEKVHYWYSREGGGKVRYQMGRPKGKWEQITTEQYKAFPQPVVSEKLYQRAKEVYPAYRAKVLKEYTKRKQGVFEREEFRKYLGEVKKDTFIGSTVSWIEKQREGYKDYQKKQRKLEAYQVKVKGYPPTKASAQYYKDIGQQVKYKLGSLPVLSTAGQWAKSYFGRAAQGWENIGTKLEILGLQQKWRYEKVPKQFSLETVRYGFTAPSLKFGEVGSKLTAGLMSSISEKPLELPAYFTLSSLAAPPIIKLAVKYPTTSKVIGYGMFGLYGASAGLSYTQLKTEKEKYRFIAGETSRLFAIASGFRFGAEKFMGTKLKVRERTYYPPEIERSGTVSGRRVTGVGRQGDLIQKYPQFKKIIARSGMEGKPITVIKGKAERMGEVFNMMGVVVDKKGYINLKGLGKNVQMVIDKGVVRYKVVKPPKTGFYRSVDEYSDALKKVFGELGIGYSPSTRGYKPVTTALSTVGVARVVKSGFLDVPDLLRGKTPAITERISIPSKKEYALFKEEGGTLHKYATQLELGLIKRATGVGKYIGGLRQVDVRFTAQAKAFTKQFDIATPQVTVVQEGVKARKFSTELGDIFVEPKVKEKPIITKTVADIEHVFYEPRYYATVKRTKYPVSEIWKMPKLSTARIAKGVTESGFTYEESFALPSTRGLFSYLGKKIVRPAKTIGYKALIPYRKYKARKWWNKLMERTLPISDIDMWLLRKKSYYKRRPATIPGLPKQTYPEILTEQTYKVKTRISPPEITLPETTFTKPELFLEALNQLPITEFPLSYYKPLTIRREKGELIKQEVPALSVKTLTKLASRSISKVGTRTRVRAVTETKTLTEALSKSVTETKALTETQTKTLTLTKTLSKTLSKTLAKTLTKTLTKTFTKTLTPTAIRTRALDYLTPPPPPPITPPSLFIYSTKKYEYKKAIKSGRASYAPTLFGLALPGIEATPRLGKGIYAGGLSIRPQIRLKRKKKRRPKR